MILKFKDESRYSDAWRMEKFDEILVDYGFLIREAEKDIFAKEVYPIQDNCWMVNRDIDLFALPMDSEGFEPTEKPSGLREDLEKEDIEVLRVKVVTIKRDSSGDSKQIVLSADNNIYIMNNQGETIETM